MRITLDGFKKLKTGEWRNKVSIRIMEFGIERDYNDRSGGERLRIDYATLLACRRLLSQSLGYSFGFISFDELFNGFDKTGKNEICDLINSIDEYTDVKQSFIMSHDDDIKNNFDNVILVEKTNEI